MSETVTAAVLKELVAAGTVREVQLIAINEGFALVAKIGMIERTLRPAHDSKRIRLFKDPGKALKYCRRDLKISKVSVDLANWSV